MWHSVEARLIGLLPFAMTRAILECKSPRQSIGETHKRRKQRCIFMFASFLLCCLFCVIRVSILSANLHYLDWWNAISADVRGKTVNAS